ncbi:MAG: hypothetical protein NTX64_01230 [Elusimicrobia bacterium]|nr:hypothetical protein [Elusimicrobiota bacterium]
METKVLRHRKGGAKARQKTKGASHLSCVRGWLDDSDPFFAAISTIVANRGKNNDRF